MPRKALTAVEQIFHLIPDLATPEQVQTSLRRILDDPSLELFWWDRESERYVDVHDSPGNLATGGGGAGPRVATPIEYETRRVGAMLHDPKLLDRDDFLEHVVRSAKEELEGAIDDLRELARGLHPPLLAQQGLEVALRADAARSAIKHARCALVRMSVVHDPGALTVEARDDGIGGASIGEGSASGLCGLRDRVEALDGTLLVESPVGSGTRLVAVFPV